MPVKKLPANPNLDHLKHQAKDLMRDHAARMPHSAQLLREFHPRFLHSTDAEIFAARLALSDAQLAIARESGFPSWTRLKRHIEKPTLTDRLDLPHHERIEDPIFRRAVNLIDAGDEQGLRAWLQQHPHLVHQHITFEGWNYFRNPTLLEFVAGNPVRHQTMPQNIVQIAKAILDCGPDQSSTNQTLCLVGTGSIPRQCQKQIPLINLLCDHNADPNTALEVVALCGEFEALAALINRGGQITLPIAAALNLPNEAHQLLASATDHHRHLALNLAAQYGRTEIVRLLLDAGEDPDRYTPVGGHSHGTPLHHAAGYGHLDVVRLLIEHGASLNQKDVLWRATPVEWAEHEGRTETAIYLRAQETNRDAKT
ncbi:MAG: ankyrin repeat domain-containing protein [Terracidiphilus sp.]